MNVRELIEVLKEYDQELPVSISSGGYGIQFLAEREDIKIGVHYKNYKDYLTSSNGFPTLLIEADL